MPGSENSTGSPKANKIIFENFTIWKLNIRSNLLNEFWFL